MMELVGKYNKLERPVKNKESEAIIAIRKQMDRWVEYFEELLNRPAPLSPSESRRI